MTTFSELLLGLLVLLYLGGIVLAILSKLNKGPFAIPKLVNTHLLTSEVSTFDLSPACKKVAYVNVRAAPSSAPHLTGPDYHAKITVSIVDFIGRKSWMSKHQLVWKNTRHNFSVRTSARCSITVEVEKYKAPMLVEVYGF